MAAAVHEAAGHTFAPVDERRVPPARRAVVRTATDEASRDAFHLAAELAAGLLVVAGFGGLALRNPRRPEVRCAECPGGQLVGAPRALAPAAAGAEH
jgi:hypothetical protein